MKVVKVKLKSISAYSQSGAIGTPKNEGEGGDDYERRTWRERIHRDEHGVAFIPPMCFKKAIDAACKYSSMKIPGRGSATYAKHIESGTFLVEPLSLNIHYESVPGDWLFLDANGKKGKMSSGRVLRCMPRFDHWEGEITVHVIDETVLQTTKRGGKDMTVLEFVIRQAGQVIGIGRFRPENGGYLGRFVVTGFEVIDMGDEDEAAA